LNPPIPLMTLFGSGTSKGGGGGMTVLWLPMIGNVFSGRKNQKRERASRTGMTGNLPQRMLNRGLQALTLPRYHLVQNPVWHLAFKVKSLTPSEPEAKSDIHPATIG